MADNKRNWNPLVFLVKLLAKCLPTNQIASTFLISFFLVFIFFIAIQLKNPNSFIFNLEICGGLYILLTACMFISAFWGRRQHKKALEGKILRQLKDLGLSIENIGDYWGYAGIIKKYYLKIFYNWSTNLSGSNNTKEICIMVYYSSPKTIENKLDVKYLDSLNTKYKNPWYASDNFILKFESAHIEIHTCYNLFTTFQIIKSRIDRAFEILEIEKLLPISEIEINKLIEKDVYRYGPSIETFWKAMDAKI